MLCLPLNNMSPDQLSRFPRLAELRLCLQNFGSAVDIDPQIKKTQELLALLPEIDQVVDKETEILQAAKEQVTSSHQRILALKSNLDQEYAALLDHMSTESWYLHHLAIAKHQREKWYCNPNQVQDLLLVWSRMDDPWKYPVALINAQHHEVIKILISCYLLYMIDIDRELMVNQLGTLEDSVQSRVKFHTLPRSSWESLDFNINIGYNEQLTTWGVPTDQMALVVVWNLFERFNLWAAEQFLGKAKDLLRPGGKIFFNTHDAESANAAAFMADGKLGGMTKDQLHALASKLDLVVSQWIPNGSDYVSVVLARPGTLQSNKTKWPLGLIKKS